MPSNTCYNCKRTHRTLADNCIIAAVAVEIVNVGYCSHAEALAAINGGLSKQDNEDLFDATSALMASLDQKIRALRAGGLAPPTP